MATKVQSITTALDGARDMVAYLPVRTAADLKSQVDILSATLLAVRRVMGEKAAAAQGPLVDLLVKKARAAGLDPRDAEALRRVLPD